MLLYLRLNMSIEEFSLEEGQIQEEESWGKESFPDVVKGRVKAAQIQAQIQQFVTRGQKASRIWEFLFQSIKDEQLLVLFFEMYKKWISIQTLAYILCPFIGYVDAEKRCDVTINKISDYINWVKKEVNESNLVSSDLFKKAIVRIVMLWNVGGALDEEVSEYQLMQAIFNELSK